MRAIGLDIHREFCEVAIWEDGETWSAGRVKTTPVALEVFASSLGPEDWGAMEVSGNAAGIARIIEPHVARVVVVSPSDTGIRQARAKTDRLDARTLARLLAAGSLDAVWMPDERTRVMRRRLARRAGLVEARTRLKNEIHAVLIRRLIASPDVSDLFGQAGRRWLRKLELPVEERETLDSSMRQIEFLDTEISEVERTIALDASNGQRSDAMGMALGNRCPGSCRAGSMRTRARRRARAWATHRPADNGRSYDHAPAPPVLGADPNPHRLQTAARQHRRHGAQPTTVAARPARGPSRRRVRGGTFREL